MIFLFDTETTGLPLSPAADSKHQPAIIEFCGRLYGEGGDIVDALDVMVDPMRPLSDEIVKITGIKPEDLKGCLPIQERLTPISEMLANADAIVAHNLAFDQRMLEIEFARWGRQLALPARRICTVEATEHLASRRLKLGELYQLLFGEVMVGAHRAASDVDALARCYFELVRLGEI